MGFFWGVALSLDSHDGDRGPLETETCRASGAKEGHMARENTPKQSPGESMVEKASLKGNLNYSNGLQPNSNDAEEAFCCSCGVQAPTF